jgi:UDP-N-acetylmuramoyl-tripeptide--D-alanyl-D-alanine ligase
MMTLRQASGWVHPCRMVGDADVAISRVHTDTRTLTAGDLFVALNGLMHTIFFCRRTRRAL